jgi:protein phosphatase
MLCSDGLNDELTDDEMAAILRGAGTPEVAVKQLIEAAVEHGGRDNVSVVIVEPDAAAFQERIAAALGDRWERLPQAARAALLGVIGGAVLVLALWALRLIG